MLLLCAPGAGAQDTGRDGNFAIKANANIGLGNAYTATSAVDGAKLDKSGNSSYEVDFHYRFWQNRNLSLGINAGLGYATGSQTITIDGMKFNYTAGADADMDGDTYQRYTEIGKASQKVSLGELIVPVYVDFNWQFCRRVSLYVNAGVNFRVSASAKIKDVTGNCDVYGIYPKYDNLKMDDEWLNDFGDHSLAGASADKVKQNGGTISLRGGAGLRVWLYGPLSLECGVNYEYGVINQLKSGSFSADNVTAETAPVTYTVAEGRKVKSFSSVLSTDKLSNLSLNLGLIFSF